MQCRRFDNGHQETDEAQAPDGPCKTSDIDATSLHNDKKEHEFADAFRNRCDETAPAVGFRMKDEGNSLEVGLDHPDKAVGELLFMHALGTTNAASLTVS